MPRRRHNKPSIAPVIEGLESRICLSTTLPTLSVHASGRTLIDNSTGKAFFYMADTAWELFHRLTRTEADTYLTNRAGLKFNVVQAVGIAELDGFNSPNAYGDRPFNNNDINSPATTPGNNPNDATQYDYWDHVDYIVDKAASLGIYTALLPTWASHVNSGQFNTSNAQTYGQFVGARYGSKNLIWVLGGDRQAWGKQDIYRSMAKGIAIGATGSENYSSLLMTYHAPDGDSSSLYFHSDAWLDFNMFQSGHGARDLANYTLLERDWNKNPPKPTLDSEPRYEGGPVGFSLANGRFNDHDARQAAYWGVFAGGFGHTYGAHPIWQMYAPGRVGFLSPANYWYEAINAPGGDDMRHLRTLMESYNLIGRVPDQGLVTNTYSGGDHVRATKGSGYALIYTPTGQQLTVNLSRIDSAQLKASWFNPRTGESTAIGNYTNTGQATFTPPTTGRPNDWVLVLAKPDQTTPPPPPPPTDTQPPEVTQARWRIDTAEPRLELTFSESVQASLSTADLIMVNLTESVPVFEENLILDYDAATQTARMRLTGFLNPLPPDGVYEVLLRQEGVSDAAGNTLAGAFRYQFQFRNADANGDGRVDIDDYFTIDSGYAQRRTGYANGDFNVNGVIDSDDYFMIDRAFVTPLVADLTPPGVSQATFLDDAAFPRLFLEFGEDVSAGLSTDDFSVFNLTTLHPVFYWDMNLAYDSGSRTATLSFPGIGQLENGHYELTIFPYTLLDAAGNYNVDMYVFAFDVANGVPA